MALKKTGVQLVAEGENAFLGTLRKGENAVNSFTSTADKAGGGVSAFGKITTGALMRVGEVAVDAMGQATKAIGSFVAGSVSAAGDFQANMNVFASVTGDALAESGKSLEDFSQLFMSLGAELPVSTAEVQDAAIELAKGGIDPATIAAGGLRTALDLAAAGGVGLADSATIMAKQLGVWVDGTADAGTKAAFLAQTADLLSQSANATTSDVSELAVGLANAGGSAKVAGLSFQETVTGLSLLAPGFSSASDAGTSFKTFVSRLVPSTKPAIDAMTQLGLATADGKSKFYDAQGSFIGLKAAAQLLQTSLSGLSEEQKIATLNTIFGQDAIRAAAILAEQGADGYDRMTASLAAAGTVQDQAKARQQGFNTALDNAQGSLEALQITIGTALLPVLTMLLNQYIAPAINTITTFANAVFGSADAFAQLSPALQSAATTLQFLGQVAGEAFASFQTDGLGAGISTFAAGLTQLSPLLGTAVGMLAPLGDLLQGNLIPAFVGLAVVIGGTAVAAFAALVAPIAGAVAAITAAVGVAGVLYAAWESDFGGIQGMVSGALSGVAGVVSSVASTIVGFWTQYGDQIMASTAATWGSIQSVVSTAIQTVLTIVQPILAQLAAFWQANGDSILGFVATTWTQIGGIIQAAAGIVQAQLQAMMVGFSALASFIGAHGAEIQAIMSATWSFISTIITTALATIQGVLTATMQIMQGNWASAWQTIQDTCATIISGIGNIIADGLSTVPHFFTITMDAAAGILGGFVGEFSTIGGDLVAGLIMGIKSKAQEVASAAMSVATNAVDAARNAIWAHSPAELPAQLVGEPFSQGVGVGITRAAPFAVQAAVKMVTSVAKAGQQLLTLQQETNAKLIDVQRKAGDKLLAIDAKVAADRKAAIKDLYASMNSDMLAKDFSFTADNLDEFEAETDEQKNQYKIREEAQRQYQERMRKARDEAREQAKDGDAELAKEVLAAKEKEAADLMSLDQKYMELRATVDKKQLPELEKRYQAAVDARREQTSDEIAIANSASQQRTQAVQDEKEAVVSEAQQATNEIVTEAQAQAAGVKGATAEMVSAATSGWHAIVGATNDATAAVKRYNAEVSSAPSPPANSSPPTSPTQAGGGGMFVAGLGAAKHIAGISAKAAGGGSFVANKPMKVLVGEAGPEMINVVPLGKPGKTTVGSGWAKMGGGGTGAAGLSSFNAIDLAGIDPAKLEEALQQLEVINRLIDEYARRNKVDPGQAKKYADTVDIIAKALTATVEIRRLMKDTGQPLDMSQISGLIDEATGIGTLFVQMNLSKKNNIGLLKEYGEAIGAVFDVIHGILEMRKELKDIPPAFELNTVMILADETRQVIRVVQQQLVKLFQEEREDLANVGEAIGAIVGILSNVIDLRSKMEDIGPPVVLEAVQSLLDDAQATLALARSLHALTTDEGDELEAVAAQVENAISIITNMADLREKTEKAKGPIDPAVIESILAEVVTLRDAVARLIAPGEQTIDGLDAYAATVEKATGIFTNILDLREKASSLPAPISDAMARSLIYDLQKLVAWFTGNIIPLAQAVVQYSEAYSTVAGQATDALNGVFDVREKLAAFPTPMSDQAVIALIHDLNKLTVWFAGNILPYAQDIVDNVDRYGQLTQTAIQSFSDAAELGAKLKAASPIPLDAVQRIAAELMLVASVFRSKMLDTAQETVDLSARYTSTTKDAIDTLQSAAELGKTLTLRYPLNMRDVNAIAAEAMLVADAFRSKLLATSQELVDLSDKNSGFISNAIGTLTGMVDLGSKLQSFTPIPLSFVLRAADDAQRVAQAFLARLIPASQEQADAADQTAGIVGSSVQALTDTLSLGSKAFDDYQSPSDAMLDQAINDADRLMQRMHVLASKYEEAGTTSAANLADALSKTAGALKDIREMVMAIAPGANFTMDTSQLAQFEQSAGQLIMVAGRLGALAAETGNAGIGNIPAIAESMNAVIDTLGRGGALDWAKVQQASAFFGGMGRMVSPPPSSSTIANSYTYNNGGNSSNVTINSNLGVAQIRAVVRQEMAASGRTAYSRKSMR